MCSVDFFHFNYSSKNNSFAMVKAAFFGIFRTEKKCSLLEAAFHFQIEVDLSQKDSKHRDEWFADGV